MQRRMLDRLAKVPEGATMCPGKLARDCGSTLRDVRPDLLDLAQAGKVTLSQGGKVVTPDVDLKGVFRVRLPKIPRRR